MLKHGPLSGFLMFGILFSAGWHEASLPGAAKEPAKVTAIGVKAPHTNSLRDLRGNRRSLHGFTGYRAVVLVFLGTECPISNLYLPGLIELEKKYRSKPVQFLAVYPNEHEDLEQVSAHAYDRDVPFPVLKDFGQRLAEAVGVTRVPTVLVLDGDFVLRYRGRIDDRYGVAFRRPRATRDDLVQALEEVLAGKKVSLAETEADGCLLDRDRRPPARTDVTFAKQIAPILQQRCQTCHRPDQAAPFSLLTYDDAVRRARMLKEVTTQRRMPPWHADPRYGHFANDRRMTREEIDLVAAWVDLGMPRGDDKDLPRPVEWAKGWTLGKPDLVIPMPEEFEVPADGALPYQNWVVDPGFTEDRWVQTAEARPGAPGVVHHIVTYILPPGQKQPFQLDGTLSVLVGWAPGDLGLVCPADTAMRIPRGSRLRFELHYTPNGKATKDRSMIGITFAKEPPKFELLTNSFANESIVVPPYHPHYRAEASLRLRADARIISFVPHMHWRGKDYWYEVIYPDGKRETLLSVPRWDFNWQNVYQLKEPLKVPKGARLHAVAHWDNSRNNPYNPAPDKAVKFGLQTWDEMMVGWVAYVWERPGTAEELAKEPLSQADLFFDRLDHNGDGVLTPDEIPDQLKPFLLLNGLKLPEKITRQEFAVMFEEMRKKFPQRRPQPDAPRKEEKKPDSKPESAKPKP
jgi:thiol-disulfide isomerase/thioredoxin